MKKKNRYPGIHVVLSGTLAASNDVGEKDNRCVLMSPNYRFLPLTFPSRLHLTLDGVKRGDPVEVAGTLVFPTRSCSPFLKVSSIKKI